MVEAREYILRGEIGWLIFMMNKKRHPSYKTNFKRLPCHRLKWVHALQCCYITILLAIMAFMIMNFQPYWRSWQEISDKLLYRMDLSNRYVSNGFVQWLCFLHICPIITHSFNSIWMCPISSAFPKIFFMWINSNKNTNKFIRYSVNARGFDYVDEETQISESSVNIWWFELMIEGWWCW